ncbi:MAG: FHA domain-containing protein [Planctomycetota bacterium]
MISYCLVSTLFTPQVRILRRNRRYVMGRDATNQFPLPSKHVSRRHAEIRWDTSSNKGFTIHDLGSKNGTKVNGETFADRRLQDGDRIVVGPFELTYREYAGDISGLLASADEWENTASLSHDAVTGSEGVVFGGAFAGSELLEIAGLLGLNEKTGVLNLTAEGMRGAIGFRFGELVRATWGQVEDKSAPDAKPEAGKTGEEAALTLLLLKAGRFEFEQVEVEETGWSAQISNLVMEAARLRDEEEGAAKGEDSAEASG